MLMPLFSRPPSEPSAGSKSLPAEPIAQFGISGRRRPITAGAAGLLGRLGRHQLRPQCRWPARAVREGWGWRRVAQVADRPQQRLERLGIDGRVGRPPTRPRTDGRLEVFARGGDNALWHNWQTAPNGGWSGWASLGGWIDRMVVGQNADGRLELFVRGADGAVWHKWQTAPNNGWTGWASLGGWIDLLDLGRNADGRLEVFARGSDGALWHKWQTAPNSGWSGWASLGLDRPPHGQIQRRRPAGGVRSRGRSSSVAQVANRAQQRVEWVGLTGRLGGPPGGQPERGWSAGDFAAVPIGRCGTSGRWLRTAPGRDGGPRAAGSTGSTSARTPCDTSREVGCSLLSPYG